MLKQLVLLLASISLASCTAPIHKLRQSRALKSSWQPQFIVQTPGSLSTRSTTDEFPVQTFTQPLDHFDKNNTVTFGQRYWVNTRHYTAGSGGPVYVLDGGETSGEDRLAFLDTGIVEILLQATGGVGIVLEHRYYGDSVPVANFSTDALRWLDNKQALQDSADFMSHVNFTGVGIDEDLTAPNTPWIYYGGSYAGARSAHMKVLYPDIVYGAIASSGVTDAKIDLWEYNDVIRKAANCGDHLANFASSIDELLDDGAESNKAIKGLFNLSGVSHDYDFVNTIESTLSTWQNKVWDPAVGDPTFDKFCDAVNGVNSTTNNTDIGSLVKEFPDVSKENLQRILDLPGVDPTLFNYAKWTRDNVVAVECSSGETQDECFGTFNATNYQGIGLEETWKLWTYQYCTQWGYFNVAPPNNTIPRIISKLHTVESESRICRMAFPAGEFNKIPDLPDVESVNVLGDFDIAADRLAIIDGEVDPWRPVTPHSQYYAKNRTDTTEQPFKLIPNAVHHYDEYGLANQTAEPPSIQEIHAQEIAFVKAWLQERNATSTSN